MMVTIFIKDSGGDDVLQIWEDDAFFDTNFYNLDDLNDIDVRRDGDDLFVFVDPQGFLGAGNGFGNDGEIFIEDQGRSTNAIEHLELYDGDSDLIASRIDLVGVFNSLGDGETQSLDFF